jgi:hypothetical protein
MSDPSKKDMSSSLFCGLKTKLAQKPPRRNKTLCAKSSIIIDDEKHITQQQIIARTFENERAFNIAFKNYH